MSFTPRRSTRGAIFTPSAAPTAQQLNQTDATYTWISGPSTRPDSPHTHYNAYSRIVHAATILGPKRKGKAKADQESRFTVGDGVLVAVAGGDEGIGILVRLWEEPEQEHDDDDDEDEEDDGGSNSRGERGSSHQGDDGEKKMTMMGEVHWCFRRQDLPGIMKNLSVEDVSRDRPFDMSMRLHRTRMRCY